MRRFTTLFALCGLIALLFAAPRGSRSTIDARTLAGAKKWNASLTPAGSPASQNDAVYDRADLLPLLPCDLMFDSTAQQRISADSVQSYIEDSIQGAGGNSGPTVGSSLSSMANSSQSNALGDGTGPGRVCCPAYEYGDVASESEGEVNGATNYAGTVVFGTSGSGTYDGAPYYSSANGIGQVAWPFNPGFSGTPHITISAGNTAASQLMSSPNNVTASVTSSYLTISWEDNGNAYSNVYINYIVTP
jgi:hypothetical protein